MNEPFLVRFVLGRGGALGVWRSCRVPVQEEYVRVDDVFYRAFALRHTVLTEFEGRKVEMHLVELKACDAPPAMLRFDTKEAI